METKIIFRFKDFVPPPPPTPQPKELKAYGE